MRMQKQIKKRRRASRCAWPATARGGAHSAAGNESPYGGRRGRGELSAGHTRVARAVGMRARLQRGIECEPAPFRMGDGPHVRAGAAGPGSSNCGRWYASGRARPHRRLGGRTPGGKRGSATAGRRPRGDLRRRSFRIPDRMEPGAGEPAGNGGSTEQGERPLRGGHRRSPQAGRSSRSGRRVGRGGVLGGCSFARHGRRDSARTRTFLCSRDSSGSPRPRRLGDGVDGAPAVVVSRTIRADASAVRRPPRPRVRLTPARGSGRRGQGEAVSRRERWGRPTPSERRSFPRSALVPAPEKSHRRGSATSRRGGGSRCPSLRLLQGV